MIRMAYVISGTEKKFRFRAVNPVDLAEFLEILFSLTIPGVKASVEEIVKHNKE
jgi:hypothetical protein